MPRFPKLINKKKEEFDLDLTYLETKKLIYPTLFVNLFGACGAGKSTISAGAFAVAKLAGLKAELITEYAKDATYEDNSCVLKNQAHVFGQQYQRMFRVMGDVEVAFTDSPILLGLLYANKSDRADLKELILAKHNQLRNMNFFLDRVKPYETYGRIQTEEESDALGIKLRVLLDDLNVPYTVIRGDTNAIGTVAAAAYKQLRRGFLNVKISVEELGGRETDKQGERQRR